MEVVVGWRGVTGTSWKRNFFRFIFWFIFCFTHSSIKMSSNVLSAAQSDLSPELSCAVVIASDKSFAVCSYFSCGSGSSFCVRSCHVMPWHAMAWHGMSCHVLPCHAMP